MQSASAAGLHRSLKSASGVFAMEIEKWSWIGLHPREIFLGCWARNHFHKLALKYVKEEAERRQRGHVMQNYPLHSDLWYYSSGCEQALSLGGGY